MWTYLPAGGYSSSGKVTVQWRFTCPSWLISISPRPQDLGLCRLLSEVRPLEEGAWFKMKPLIYAVHLLSVTVSGWGWFPSWNRCSFENITLKFPEHHHHHSSPLLHQSFLVPYGKLIPCFSIPHSSLSSSSSFSLTLWIPLPLSSNPITPPLLFLPSPYGCNRI